MTNPHLFAITYDLSYIRGSITRIFYLSLYLSEKSGGDLPPFIQSGRNTRAGDLGAYFMRSKRSLPEPPPISAYMPNSTDDLRLKIDTIPRRLSL